MQDLTASQVIAIHERVILPHELQGMAHNKSIDAVLGRIENRLTYGLIGDCFELAACYLCYVSVGHCFHDANKRTAHTAMQVILKLNGIRIDFEPEKLGEQVILAAQGRVEDYEFAAYLRSLSIAE